MSVLVKKVIMLWEPHEGLRESFKLILGDDYRLLFVNSIEEILDYCGHRIDLLILNADDGPVTLETVASIKEKCPDLKILLITTNLKLDFQIDILRLGTDIGFREKPWDSDELKDKIDTMIRGYSEERHTHIVRIKIPPGQSS